MLQIQVALRVFVRVYLVVQRANMRLLVRAHQEQHHRQYQTHLDSDRQVEDHRQKERHQQHPEVTGAVLGQTRNGLPAAHRVCHHDQYRRQTRHRNHTYQLTKEQQHQQQHDRVYHTRDRRAPAVIDISHRTRDSTRRRDSAEEGHHHIRNTLRD